jgi:hypothetical protein
MLGTFLQKSEAMTLRRELTERQRYWLDHIESCEQLGQSTKAYAELHGLSVSMMYSWRKKLSAKGVLSDRTKSCGPSRFERVRVVGAEPLCGECCITLPNGVQIGFSGAVDGGLLSTVLHAASRL